ncbi:M42 family metallopeptidase [Schleiferilactobacillus shenzhenensis]|uniref:Uncharacterized protein n=1 Tax=Schleiferilactobacillus shenzhenensis LY-73 TaxID=1231336 RepID=U4TZE9_9LACO|nr:M20/M25/M40 family metallo-hydrolase [Schleiferilactobacillus shenzhenensis]ERL66682.1 hypothetical protein L248_0361 [Schleiferilactobacillus shenzhenensis LY-73]
MSKEESIALIRDLSNANGVSGFEDDVVQIAKDYVAPYADVQEDHMRNLRLSRHGNTQIKPRLMLDAHSDEVGYMIQAIKPNGTMRFVTVGGQAAVTLPAHKVRVRNNDGDWLPGIITSTPPHFMTAEERRTLPPVSALTIDVGATSADEVRTKFGIDVGAPVVPAVQCEYIPQSDTLLGKAFDNRIGTALLLETIKDLADEELAVDVVGSLSSQEEVGERGATVMVRKIQPDLAIVFEGAPADDTVMPDYMIQSGLHRGPMLRDFDTSIIANPRFQALAIQTAQAEGIKYQRSVRSGGGNDGAVINLYGGAPTIVISVPVRFAHTAYCYIAYDDFAAAKALAIKLIKQLTPAVIDQF